METTIKQNYGNCCQRADTDIVFFCRRKCNARVDEKGSECKPHIVVKFFFDVFEYLLHDEHDDS